MYNGDQLWSLSDTVTFVNEAFKDIAVNGYTFAIGSGFPTTGYPAGKFTLTLPAGKTATDYTWVSSQPWVTVSSAGVVSFIGEPATSTKSVKITAASQTGMYTFNFSINSWYVFGSNHITQSAAATYCSQQGLSTPSAAQTTNAASGGRGTRAMGTLWSEWGNLGRTVTRSDMYFWVSATSAIVGSTDGHNWSNYGNGNAQENVEALCRKSL